MEESLEKALEFSNYSVTLNNQKRILSEKYQENLIIYYLGGTFTANREELIIINEIANIFFIVYFSFYFMLFMLKVSGEKY